ncbi:hypothetical protein EUGRSUZ_D01771, partial [Eucalyptus grandis]
LSSVTAIFAPPIFVGHGLFSVFLPCVHALEFPILPLPSLQILVPARLLLPRPPAAPFPARRRPPAPPSGKGGGGGGGGPSSDARLLRHLLRGRAGVRRRPGVPARVGRDGGGGQGGAPVPARASAVRDHGGLEARHVRGREARVDPELLVAGGGMYVEVFNRGVIPLAYSIKKKNKAGESNTYLDGIYLLFTYFTKPESIETLEATLNTDDDVIRSSTFKIRKRKY